MTELTREEQTEVKPTLVDQVSGRNIILAGDKFWEIRAKWPFITQETEYSIGVRVDMPFHKYLKKIIRDKHGIDFPEKITKITILDMAAEENLPISDRKFISGVPQEKLVKPKDSRLNSILKFITKLSQVEADPLHHMSYEVEQAYAVSKIDAIIAGVGLNNTKKKELNAQMFSFHGDTFVIVLGHGGGDKLKIGEKFLNRRDQQNGELRSSLGNSIKVEKIIEYIEENISANTVFMSVCNEEKDQPKSLNRKFILALPQSVSKGTFTPETGILSY